jgi:hypothetical protein
MAFEAEKRALTDAGWVTLLQLGIEPTEAGDLISKPGRNELLKIGLCAYGEGDQRWRLTEDGAKIAMHMLGSNWLHSAMH